MPLFTEPFIITRTFSRLEPRCGGVYALEHVPTGLAYIGQSHSLCKRWTQHRVDLRRGVHVCTPLQGLFFDAPEGEFAFLALAIVPGGKLRKPRDAVNAPHQRIVLERRWFWTYRSRGLALNREIMPRDEVCLYPLFDRDAQRTPERKALLAAEAAQIGLEFSSEPLRTSSRHRSATLAGVKNFIGGVKI